MRTLLNDMRKKKYGISEDSLAIFENIIQTHYVPGYGSREGEDAFKAALGEHLTEQQRFRLFEQHGACKGTSADKERKSFALEHEHMTLAERVALFNKTFGRNAVLHDDNTITVNFACTHGYYKRVKEKKVTSLPPAAQSYFEQCAGGRLYELEKALGIKLAIKSADISPLSENLMNPVVFTFAIAD